MQIFFMFTPTSSKQGTETSNSKIQDSGLGKVISRIFASFSFPDSVAGCVKLQQRQDNLDAFDFFFCPSIDSKAYIAGRCYSALDIDALTCANFEQFPDSEHDVQSRLQEFCRRLVDGELTEFTPK